jgi:hypothetical protein
MDYTTWEDKVITAVQELDEVTRGDAQSIVEAAAFRMQQSWCLGLDAQATARRVLGLSAANSAEGK